MFSFHIMFCKLTAELNSHDSQILEETDILFPDDELDILDLDEDELLFEVGLTKHMLPLSK